MNTSSAQMAFGISIVPAARAVRLNRDLVRVAEAAGLDLIGIQDHPYVGEFVDTWSLMATLLVETQRLRFFPDVASLPLRLPAVIAKAAATLDVLSGGRFALGIGAGAYWERAGIPGQGDNRPSHLHIAIVRARRQPH